MLFGTKEKIIKFWCKCAKRGYKMGFRGKIDKQMIATIKSQDFLSLFLRAIIYIGVFFTLATIALIVGYILLKGIPHLSLKIFEFEYSTLNASMTPAIINTLFMILLSLVFALPFGIFGAIFLQEYAKNTSLVVALINLASQVLVGIPSIVYGLFGFLAFVIYFKMGVSMLSGALTLAVMILPLILTATQESLKSVPNAYKEGSFALGAGKLRTIFVVVLPCAMSGILSGVILSIGRIIGESAALLYTSGSVAKVAGVGDSGRTLSVHLYALLSEGQFIEQSYATAVVLLFIVVGINLLSNVAIKRFGAK